MEMCVSYGETTTTGPKPVRARQRSTMFINSTREFVDMGTFCSIGQQVNWNN